MRAVAGVVQAGMLLVMVVAVVVMMPAMRTRMCPIRARFWLEGRFDFGDRTPVEQGLTLLASVLQIAVHSLEGFSSALPMLCIFTFISTPEVAATKAPSARMYWPCPLT